MGDMRLLLGIAAIAAMAVPLAGCGGSKSVDELARDRFGANAGPCRVVALIELGKVYQCDNGYGGWACVTRDGDDLFDVNTERYRIIC